jgi:hypothetical protein
MVSLSVCWLGPLTYMQLYHSALKTPLGLLRCIKFSSSSKMVCQTPQVQQLSFKENGKINPNFTLFMRQ